MSQKGEALIFPLSLLFVVVYCQTEASNLEKKYLVKFEGSFHKDNIWYSWYG